MRGVKTRPRYSFEGRDSKGGEEHDELVCPLPEVSEKYPVET